MGEQDSRDLVLARIRGSGLNSRITNLYDGSVIRELSPDPVGRFVARAEAAQAAVTVVRDFDEARQRVVAILADVQCDRPLVSGDARRAPWAVAVEGPRDPTALPAEASAEAGAGSSLSTAVAGVTCAAYGVADTGTIVVCSGPAGGRLESLVPPVHIALLAATDIVAGLPELLSALTRDGRLEQSSAVTLITGPSRTADIELTLTIGVHGPKQLFIIVVDTDSSSATIRT